MSLQQKRTPVIAGTRKRFQKGVIPPPSDSPGKRLQDAQASVKSSTAPLRIPVFDAGGGAGHENLKFNTLNSEQVEMYKRTLKSTVLEDDNQEQETRQLSLNIEYTTYIVNISREDFPSKSADIEVKFTQIDDKVEKKFLFESDFYFNVSVEDSNFIKLPSTRKFNVTLPNGLKLTDPITPITIFYQPNKTGLSIISICQS